jgi:small subunit ribosomal protein S2
MKPYILTIKKGTHIIDIQKTKKTLEFAYQIIKKFAEREASFIFVGTRKQAKETIKFNALRTNSLYVSER